MTPRLHTPGPGASCRRIRTWNSDEPRSIWSAIRPFVEEGEAIGLIAPTPTAQERLALLPGDLTLSRFEDDLSSQWRECLDGTRLRPFLVTSAFWTVLRSAAERHDADVVLVDVGPSLGAINRAALVASDHVVVPVAPDLFSLQGLRNLGPTLHELRGGWRKRLHELRDRSRPLPVGNMAPLGYIVLGEREPPPAPDPDCLARLKHYHSLMPLAQEARKPVFALKPADGTFGGHAQAAQRAYGDFRSLAIRIHDDVSLGGSAPAQEQIG